MTECETQQKLTGNLCENSYTLSYRQKALSAVQLGTPRGFQTLTSLVLWILGGQTSGRISIPRVSSIFGDFERMERPPAIGTLGSMTD